MNFLDEIKKEIKNEYAGIADDGIVGGETTFVDTGSYSLNAAFCGSIYGGIGNKVSVLAGEQAVGKTFFCLAIAKLFLDNDPEAVVAYFESEGAITKDMLEGRGIDLKRFMLIPVATVEEFRHQAVKILDMIKEKKKSERPKLLTFLDSMGNLSTEKEITDIAEGSLKRDMTRAQLFKGAFRVLTLKMGLLDVPMIATNHVYDVIGSMYPTKEMGGGSGAKYAASTIGFITKAKMKDGNDVIGNILTVTINKGRFTKENSRVKTMLDYIKGLDRYYGLLELAEEAGIWQKVSTRYEVDGVKVFGKTIQENPEKYFTKEVLDKIDAYTKKKFMYGSDYIEPEIDEAVLYGGPENQEIVEEHSK